MYSKQRKSTTIEGKLRGEDIFRTVVQPRSQEGTGEGIKAQVYFFFFFVQHFTTCLAHKCWASLLEKIQYSKFLFLIEINGDTAGRAERKRERDRDRVSERYEERWGRGWVLNRHRSQALTSSCCVDLLLGLDFIQIKNIFENHSFFFFLNKLLVVFFNYFDIAGK